MGTRQKKHDQPNPLAYHLGSIHSATVDRIESLADGLLEITATHGLTVENHECRTSTDDEAAQADIWFPHDKLTIDMRGDFAANVARNLRELSRRIGSVARKIERQIKRGTLPATVNEYYLQDGGERVSGSYSADDHKAAFYDAQRHHAQVVRVTGDGSEEVIHDFTKSDTAA